MEAYTDFSLAERIMPYWRLGWTEKEVAQRMGIAVVTVEYYFRVLDKLYNPLGEEY